MTRRHSNGAASFARRSGSRPRSTFLASGGSASGCSTVPRCTTADDMFTSGKTAVGTGTGGAAGRASQTAAANRALATARAAMMPRSCADRVGRPDALSRSTIAVRIAPFRERMLARDASGEHNDGRAGRGVERPAGEDLMSRVLTLFFAAVFVATACGQTPTTPSASASGAASATAAAITRGGTVIVAIWQEPSTLAAHYQNQTVSGVVTDGVIEGLASTTNDGNYVPVLAQTVPDVANGGVVVKGTKMDVTWKLKPGIKWSDGEPLDSSDIKYTWDIWMKDPKTNNRTGFDQIESIDTPDATTAIVHYKAIYAPYPLNFGALMPRHLLEKEADISKTDYNRKPLGTGPFKVTDFKAGDSITLEKNTNYREQGKPYLDKIIFKSVPSSQVALAHLQAGEVQAMWNLTEAQTPDVEKTQGLALQVTPAPTVERIEINTVQNREYPDPNSTHPILADVAVRKALLYATPKQQIIDKLLFGKAKPGSSPVSQGWAKYTGTQEGYDPAKANSTLEASSWVKGSDGIRTKN